MALAAVFFTFIMVSMATAKSVYVIANINATPTPIQAYDIQGNQIVFQASYGVPYFGWGAVGLAIDTDSKTLFVTYEQSNVIQLLDATTMADLGTTTAPGASNLAGIVVDQELQKVYTVDRHTDNFYVYDWDASTRTLILDAQYDLPGVGGAFGLALDETNDILYVSNNSPVIYSYSTSDFITLAGTITVSGNAIGIAVDPLHGFLYSGAGWSGNYNLSQYNLSTNLENTIYLGSGIGVMGVSVDLATGYVYCSTGYAADDFRVYDMSLSLTDQTGYIGNPTGVVVPGAEVSFNPLNLTKDDGIASGECAHPGGNINYTISYDNTLNTYDVTDVTITDNLPPELIHVSGGTYDSGTHTVSWYIGTLTAGSSGGSETLVAKVASATLPGQITNVCRIISNETGPTTVNKVTEVCEAGCGDYLFVANRDVEFSRQIVSDGDIHANDDVEFSSGNPSTHYGNLTAVDEVEILRNNTIVGDATAGDEVEISRTSAVTGTVTEYAAVDSIILPTLSFTTGGDDIEVEKNDSLALAPGSYGEVEVKRNGILHLSSGEYFLWELEMDKPSKLYVDITNGPVTEYKLKFKYDVEMIMLPTENSTQVTFNKMGRKTVDIGKYSRIFGTFIAPEAKVEIKEGASFKGSVCANEVKIHQYSTCLHHNSTLTLPKFLAKNHENPPEIAAAPLNYELNQNYPNPFNPTTTIRFALPEASRVSVKIYNAAGQLVRTLANGYYETGTHSVQWDATDDNGVKTSSGIYFYRLQTKNFQQVKKMLLLK